MLACGRHDHQEYAHAVGIGAFDAALDIGEFFASAIVKNKAGQWYARQRCTDPACNVKSAPMEYVIGDLKVDFKHQFWPTLWIIGVRVQILAWFYCDPAGFTGGHTLPPEEAIPQQYHHGHRPRPSDP